MIRMARNLEREMVTAMVLVPVFVVGIPSYIWAGLTSYFMNDLPGGDDHLRFAKTMLTGAMLAGVLSTVWIQRTRRWTALRAAACGLGGAIAINGALLCWMFAFGAEDIGAEAPDMYDGWTAGQAYGLAAVCGLLALIGAAAVVRAIHTSPPTES